MGKDSEKSSVRAVRGRLIKKTIPEYSFRWRGRIEVKVGEKVEKINIPGSIAQWLRPGEIIEVVERDGQLELYKFYGGQKIRFWPVFHKEYVLKKRDPLTGGVLYEYRVLAREAIYEEDFYYIVELEQYHYASKKELVAIWWDPSEMRFVESNVKPSENAVLIEIKGSLPVSRFLILELVDREPYEPKVVGYVRIDPPIPLVHRRLPDGKIDENIRVKIFPRDWFYPTFWPERLSKNLALIYRDLKKAKSRRLSRKEFFELIKKKAMRICNTAAARISRVVIHPDYRGEGLGMLAVTSALEWIKNFRVPEMKKEKHVVETIAQMARYNPFFEKVGFVYLFETKSKRPYLAYPLTDIARRLIEKYLEEDPYAREHKGKLYKSSYKPSHPFKDKIILRNVTKMYTTELDISNLPEDIQDVLKAFGVEKRIVQRYVLKDVNLEICPGEIAVVVGISGAGKTTLLRLIIGKVLGLEGERYIPDSGEVKVPDDVKLACMLPGEIEPNFGEETILEHMYRKLGDIVSAIEVLNYSGLSDAVFYRARFSELSTGQKERAKIASLLAEKPNLIIIDEFCSHLDTLTAQRVARKLAKIAREHKVSLIVVTHKPELIKVLNPDKLIYVGYGGVTVKQLTSPS